MRCVGFEPTIPVSERAKTVHAIDRLATMTGVNYNTCYILQGPIHMCGMKFASVTKLEYKI
jgi:hypothetical protein